jgi:hypothetical protein
MDVALRLVDLATMHPRLLWETIVTAAAAVLSEKGNAEPYPFALTVQNVPGFGDGELRMAIDPVGVSLDWVARVRRTYEPSRLVELAAIAVCGLGLYQAGGHEIRDVAARGSGADYLMDEANHHLEIAGRSRRVDLAAAWDQKCQRLSAHGGNGYYVFVAEWETPAGRLAFVE